MNWKFGAYAAICLALALWVGWTVGRRQLAKKILARWPFVRADLESVDPEVAGIDKPVFPKLIWFGLAFLALVLVGNMLYASVPE